MNKSLLSLKVNKKNVKLEAWQLDEMESRDQYLSFNLNHLITTLNLTGTKQLSPHQ